MVTHPKTFTHIARRSDILGGEPIIAGTRLPVRAVVLTNRYAPNAEYIYGAYPSATREEIDEALAFYEANRTEIDRCMAENDDDALAVDGGA